MCKVYFTGFILSKCGDAKIGIDQFGACPCSCFISDGAPDSAGAEITVNVQAVEPRVLGSLCIDIPR